MMAIITEKTAVAIAMAHREIASAENLLKDLPPPQTEQAA